MKTICLQIGNSDGKLTQVEWKDYCNEVYNAIQLWSDEIFFSAPSVGWADWQNACFVINTPEENIETLKNTLIAIRKAYLQDSVAWLEGTTDFL